MRIITRKQAVLYSLSYIDRDARGFINRSESVVLVITALTCHISICTRHSAYLTVEVVQAWDQSECKSYDMECILIESSCFQFKNFIVFTQTLEQVIVLSANLVYVFGVSTS